MGKRELAGLLHDIGMIGVSEDILNKAGALSADEFESIKKHVEHGVKILEDIKQLSDVVEIIKYHHERFDGSGYSTGLKGQEIPLGARIIAILDVYQALISDRPYRKAYNEKEALGVIREGAGKQFDPELVKIFMQVIDAIQV